MQPTNDLPPPGIVADMCAAAAWDQRLDPELRSLFERSADTIRSLIVCRMFAVNRAEHLEAEVETYAALLYGPNRKGGAT